MVCECAGVIDANNNFIKEKTMSQRIMKITAAILLSIACLTAHAAPRIYDSQTGQYLGNLSSNKFDPNSTSNPYGPHGSPYSPTSINNPYSPYGSPYSNKSVNNPYATGAPVIIDNDD